MLFTSSKRACSSTSTGHLLARLRRVGQRATMSVSPEVR
jgi:hypothetical protein